MKGSVDMNWLGSSYIVTLLNGTGKREFWVDDHTTQHELQQNVPPMTRLCFWNALLAGPDKEYSDGT